MDVSKIIRGIVNSRGYTITSAITQWDYGYVFVPEFEDMPATYRLDFSNDEHHGTALPVYCGSEGGEVPEELIDTGKDIWVWFFYIGDGFGKSEYKWRIPNKCKPKTEQDEPTPSQQSSIDQAISVVNDAVERAEDAQEAIENMSVSAQTLAEGESATVTKTESEGVVHLEFGIPKGATGDTPTITASKTGSTTSIYVDGSEIAQIEDGTDGIDGDDGYSPTASVDKSGKTATITITDKTGTTSAQVEDGTDGTDGVSPTVSITPITGGHRITITDKDGSHSADVMDGTGNVDDVQINGTSITENGVADIPIASNNNLGVVKTNSNKGVLTGSDGILGIRGAGSDITKNGTTTTYPLVPAYQHVSAFYGLAKAAGYDDKSSVLPMGQYSDEAKVAIQKMLGIYEAPWELIREDTFTNAEAAEYVINTDDNGESFKLTEVVFLFETPVQDTQAALGSYGSIYAYFNNGNPKKVECGAYTQNANASAHGCAMIIKRDGNMIEMSRLVNTAAGNSMGEGYRYGVGFTAIPSYPASDRLSFALINDNQYVTKITILSILGTGHYKLYGRRKWQ